MNECLNCDEFFEPYNCRFCEQVVNDVCSDCGLEICIECACKGRYLELL